MPYTLNGTLLDIASPPELKDGVLFVPLRKVGEALGGTLNYDADGRHPILYINNQIVTLGIGEEQVDVDGVPVLLQAAPFLRDGETWVPVRFFERALGYTLVADPQNGLVHLTS